MADGKRAPGKSAFEATPVLLGDMLYFCSPFNRVFALDAETGRSAGYTTPRSRAKGVWLQNCRGVAAWVDRNAAPGTTCGKRIFEATIDARLIALDADTGKPCADFGRGGAVDLKQGVGDPAPG